MGAIAERVRGTLGRRAPEPPQPEGPPPRNLRREYLHAWRAFLALPYPQNAAPAAAIRALRAEADEAGLGEALDGIWLGEPEYSNPDPGYRGWLVAKLNHFEGRGPDPGARPPPPPPQSDMAAWEAEWRNACWALLVASKSGASVAAAEQRLISLRQLIAERTGKTDEMCRRCVELPGTREPEILDAWWAEAGVRWQTGAHGGHWPVHRPIPRPVVSVAEIEERDAARRSAVVLMADHGGMVAGTWAQLDAATSHELVEQRRAVWARNAPIPEDTRPPIEAAPGEDWVEIIARDPIRLTTRHRMAPGDMRRVAPDEAAALIRAHKAKLPEPPPPEPVRAPVVFE